jgi:hypothetical protein
LITDERYGFRKNKPGYFYHQRVLMHEHGYIRLKNTDLLNQNKKNMVQKTYYKTKDYVKVKFSFTVENAETIEILGLNSDWANSIIKKKKDGTFSAEVNLPKETKHQFKYRINETDWANEPEADGEVANEFGGSNSLLAI